MMEKKIVSAMIVAVAAFALLTVSFVPHHHHNGFMCMENGHFAVDSGLCGTHGECGTDDGACASHDGCGERGDGHSEDRSNCVEDEVFLTSRPESRGMDILPPPVQLFLAIFIAYLSDDKALDNIEQDFGDLPPCLYKSANLDGTFSLRAPPFLLS